MPLARYVGSHWHELPIPFKRYQIDTVFRDDDVDHGHFREFTQCDGDVVGVNDLTADAEVVNMAHAGLSKLGFSNFRIKVNHREIISALAQKAGMQGDIGRLQMQRALDAASKFSEKWPYHHMPHYAEDFARKIKQILKDRELSELATDVILEMLLVGDRNVDLELSNLARFLNGYECASRGIEELRKILSYLDSEVSKTVKLDVFLSRGADYYTGFILEGNIPGIGIGAVLGGGRYDNLVKNLGGPDLPAVGMAFGLDRIIVAMVRSGATLPFAEKGKRIIAVPRTENDKVVLMRFSRDMRRKGIDVDCIMLESMSISGIVDYAKKRDFSFLALACENGKVKISSLGNGCDHAELIPLFD